MKINLNKGKVEDGEKSVKNLIRTAHDCRVLPIKIDYPLVGDNGKVLLKFIGGDDNDVAVKANGAEGSNLLQIIVGYPYDIQQTIITQRTLIEKRICHQVRTYQMSNI